MYMVLCLFKLGAMLSSMQKGRTVPTDQLRQYSDWLELKKTPNPLFSLYYAKACHGLQMGSIPVTQLLA